MADNDYYILEDPLQYGKFDSFTTLLTSTKTSDVCLTMVAEYDEYSRWTICEAGTAFPIGSITLQFEPSRNELVFCWTDSVMHADIESSWKEALRKLGIVHYRKNYQL